MASVVAGAASAFSCFRLGLIVERDLAQHDALASLVDEVGPALVVILLITNQSCPAGRCWPSQAEFCGCVGQHFGPATKAFLVAGDVALVV